MASNVFFLLFFGILFSNLITSADMNTINCHLPVLMSVGYFILLKKIKLE